MQSRKDSVRSRVAAAALGGAVAPLTSATASASPQPDPVARVPLVGLLSLWTWDPAHRPAPPSGPGPTTAADNVAAARRFVTSVLAEQGATVLAATGYRLDDPQLVAVVAELERQDGTSSSVAFTVRVTPSADGSYSAGLFLEDR